MRSIGIVSSFILSLYSVVVFSEEGAHLLRTQPILNNEASSNSIAHPMVTAADVAVGITSIGHPMVTAADAAVGITSIGHPMVTAADETVGITSIGHPMVTAADAAVGITSIGHPMVTAADETVGITSIGHPMVTAADATVGITSIGHPMVTAAEAAVGITSIGHPMVTAAEAAVGITSIGNPMVNEYDAAEPVSLAVNHTSYDTDSLHDFSAFIDLGITDGYYFGEFDPRLVAECRSSVASDNDFFTLDQIGLKSNQFHYSYDVKSINELLVDGHAKVLMYHGDVENLPDNLMYKKYIERLQLFTAASSDIQRVMLTANGSITRADGTPIKVILPSIASRLKTIFQTLETHNARLKPTQVSALALHYDCMAEFLAAAPNSVAFGLRGSTIQKYDLRPVKLYTSQSRGEDMHPHELKITSPIVLMTSKFYGEEGEKLFSIVDDLMTSRIREDGETISALNQ